jgi:hypothetical protein
MVQRLRSEQDVKYWQAAFKTAEEQYEAHRVHLDALDTERAEVVHEMQQLERLMESITPFTTVHHMDGLNQFIMDYTPDPEGGLADACRVVLRQANRYMTAIELRDALEASKYDLSQHSNALASIHSVLKRFEESGEVSMVVNRNKPAYKMKPRWMLHLKGIAEKEVATDVSQKDYDIQRPPPKKD